MAKGGDLPQTNHPALQTGSIHLVHIPGEGDLDQHHRRHWMDKPSLERH